MTEASLYNYNLIYFHELVLSRNTLNFLCIQCMGCGLNNNIAEFYFAVSMPPYFMVCLRCKLSFLAVGLYFMLT